jgi:D-alanyl-D-alanine carboxypeptidase/D-alanyl-D-alanine-endopeptidase (penicillin-binding protein 4)
MILLRLFFLLCIGITLLTPAGVVHAADAGREMGDSSSKLTPPPKDLAARKIWLRERLDELFMVPSLAKAKLSVAVMDPESGKYIYTKNEKNQVNIASNVKLATEAAALSALGPEFRWKTTVLGSAPAEGGKIVTVGGELKSDLYLRTSGDPTLDTEALSTLAAQLASLGLRKVRGGLVIDTTVFDNAFMPPAFEQKNESAAYRAPSSAASLEGNVVTITLIPGSSVGARARVVIFPASPAIVLTGTVLTVGKEPALPRVETSDGGGSRTRVTLSGRIAIGSEPRVFQKRVWMPETFLGLTFRQILQKRGISFDKPNRIEAAPKDGLRALAAYESPTLAVVVHELGKRSSNFAAEQVLRTMGGEVLGRPGTWQKGLEVVARYLEGIGIPKTAYVMKNGSGLYDSNRFSAEQVTLILRAATRDFRISSEFLASLAVGAADGTLAHRMANTPAERYVRGKTGTLSNVSCLSGVVGAPGIKPLLFSILINDHTSSIIARNLQDRATSLLVLFLDPTLTPITP